MNIIELAKTMQEGDVVLVKLSSNPRLNSSLETVVYRESLWVYTPKKAIIRGPELELYKTYILAEFEIIDNVKDKL